MIILGFPYHYAPHGFVGSKKFNISMEDGNFYTGLQALELKEKAFNDVAEDTEKLQLFGVYHRFNAMFAKKNVLFVKFFIANSIATGKVIDFFSGVDVAGYALFSDVYEVTEQEAVEFDKSFPLKENQIYIKFKCF